MNLTSTARRDRRGKNLIAIPDPWTVVSSDAIAGATAISVDVASGEMLIAAAPKDGAGCTVLQLESVPETQQDVNSALQLQTVVDMGPAHHCTAVSRFPRLNQNDGQATRAFQAQVHFKHDLLAVAVQPHSEGRSKTGWMLVCDTEAVASSKEEL